MITEEKVSEVKKSLFTIVQYCHDNDKDFIERFCVTPYEEIESLNAVYLSGSSAVIMYTHWRHDELYDKTIPVQSQSLLDWIIEHQKISAITKRNA